MSKVQPTPCSQNPISHLVGQGVDQHPSGSQLFLVPDELIPALEHHPITQGVFLTGAGIYRQDVRHFVCPALPYHLLYFCFNGRAALHTPQGSFPLNAGDLAVVPAGTPHTTSASSTHPWSFYFLGYGGKVSRACNEWLNASHRARHVGLEGTILQEFEALCAVRLQPFTLDRMVAASARMCSLLTQLSLQQAPCPATGSDKLDIPHLRALMQARVDGSLTLAELATHTNRSLYHFAHCFKRDTGTSPIQYYIQVRMQHACDLLERSNQSIKQIAAGLGYDDPLYFSRAFRKVVGQSPSSYRKRHRAPVLGGVTG